MEDEDAGGVRRRWCLALLIFLFVYIPLDAFDADTSDTFDGGVVQVKVQAGEDAVHSALQPAVILQEFPKPLTGLCALTLVLGPIPSFLVLRESLPLPRSDDPHVASPPSAKLPVHPVLV